MKICMFAKGLPVHILGGMETQVNEIVNGLVERGHKVTVITTKHPRGIEKEVSKNLRIFYVGNKSLKYTRKFHKESAKLFKILDVEEDFDIIHSQSVSGFGFVEYANSKKPFIITLHGSFKREVSSAFYAGGIKNWFVSTPYLFLKYILSVKKKEKRMLDAAKKVLTDTKETKLDIMQQYKIPEEKFVLVYNGIDTEKFRPINVENFRNKLGFSRESKFIVSSGRITRQKGYHLLIKILPDLLKKFDTKLIIIGKGEYLDNLKKLTEKLKVSGTVIFTGKISDKEMINYYNLADVFAFPTLRWESFGIVIAEAMSCGKPAISTNIGAIPSVIDDSENGFLIDSGNTKQLRDKILTLFENEELAKKMGKNARNKIVEKFDKDRINEIIIKSYRETANNFT